MPENDRIAWFMRTVGGAASWLYLVVVGITAYEVTMRYVFNAPTLWVHELSVALAATCFVIGGPLVHQDRTHITISVVYDRMSPVARRWARALSSLLTLVFCGFLTYATFVQAGHALKVMEKTGTALNWPIPVYLKTLFAVCAVVMTLQTLLHLARDVAVLRDRAGGT